MESVTLFTLLPEDPELITAPLERSSSTFGLFCLFSFPRREIADVLNMFHLIGTTWTHQSPKSLSPKFQSRTTRFLYEKSPQRFQQCLLHAREETDCAPVAHGRGKDKVSKGQRRIWNCWNSSRCLYWLLSITFQSVSVHGSRL